MLKMTMRSCQQNFKPNNKNMGKKNPSPATGLSLPVVVFVVFLILKLTNLVKWSWWWITSPLWIVVALVVVLAVIYFCVIVFRAKKH